LLFPRATLIVVAASPALSKTPTALLSTPKHIRPLCTLTPRRPSQEPTQRTLFTQLCSIISRSYLRNSAIYDPHYCCTLSNQPPYINPMLSHSTLLFSIHLFCCTSLYFLLSHLLDPLRQKNLSRSTKGNLASEPYLLLNVPSRSLYRPPLFDNQLAFRHAIHWGPPLLQLLRRIECLGSPPCFQCPSLILALLHLPPPLPSLPHTPNNSDHSSSSHLHLHPSYILPSSSPL